MSDRINELESEIEGLPIGYISKKNINGTVRYYRQWKEDGKLKSKYIPNDEIDIFAELIEKRRGLQRELQKELQIEELRNKQYLDAAQQSRLQAYVRELHLGYKPTAGFQDYDFIVENRCFYVDKTDFIREWWNSADAVTLITRPRRFGKTLNLSMIECFFSPRFAGRFDLFENMSVWSDMKLRKLQGTIPTIFVSFGGVKEHNAKGQLYALKNMVSTAYTFNRYILDKLPVEAQEEYKKYTTLNMTDNMALSGIADLSEFIYTATGKKSIILIDEYDTPMIEASNVDAWEECAANMRLFFNKTLKTNKFLDRAIMTGITRISKESFFSDLNNLRVYSMTSNKYADSFGFTELEVREAMKAQGLDNFEEVKRWYDGFTVGYRKDIYNPWSITNFLEDKKLEPYWIHTSSNKMINKIFQQGSPELKLIMEEIMNGGTVKTYLKEETVISEIWDSEVALWSLLFASGYMKIVDEELDSAGEKIYTLACTNLEVRLMFRGFIKDWFSKSSTNGYRTFIKALMEDDVDYMNEYMSSMIHKVFSFYDTSGNEPERFYHGLVLGMMLDLEDKYIITSNRESGLGRYDVLLEPRNADIAHAIILEFKVHKPRKEKTMEESVKVALQQIEDKKYDDILLQRGIKTENIYKYGIAFRGKEVLIDGGADDVVAGLLA